MIGISNIKTRVTGRIVDGTFTNEDISAGATIYTHIAASSYLMHLQAFFDGIAGGGDYLLYLTKQRAGAGSTYPVMPTTTVTVGAGVTAFASPTILVGVSPGDVIGVYADGLAGDVAVSGKIEIYALV